MENETPTPEVIAIVPPLAYVYDEDDERVNAILDKVAEFCGHEFTKVPQNPDEEPGVPVPLDDTEETPIDPDDPDKTGQIDPDIPGEPYPGQTDELDKLREEYKAAKEKNLEEKQSYWAVLWQVIRLISNTTCWTENYNDTFIYQHRTQTHTEVKIPYCQYKSLPCSCPKPLSYELYYAPVGDCTIAKNEDDNSIELEHTVKPFIGGEIHAVDPVTGYQVEKIPAEYLNTHYNPHTQKVIINPMDFPILGAGKCECPEEVDIVLHYNAGYCTIPQALLPLVCQLMHKIEDAKVSINDCAGAMTQVSGLLKSKKIGNIQYQWSDKDTEQSKTQALFTEIYNLANMDELFSLSRCDIINQEEMGDVI